MSAEQRDVVDATPLYTLGSAQIGRLMPTETEFVVITRADYVAVAESVLDNCPSDDLREELMHVARTADRFALGSWMSYRGCGCLVGEYLVAQELAEHNADALAARWAVHINALSVMSVARRLRRNRPDDVEELLLIGDGMDEAVRDFLAERLDYVPYDGTVFIRDEVTA